MRCRTHKTIEKWDHSNKSAAIYILFHRGSILSITPLSIAYHEATEYTISCQKNKHHFILTMHHYEYGGREQTMSRRYWCTCSFVVCALLFYQTSCLSKTILLSNHIN